MMTFPEREQVGEMEGTESRQWRRGQKSWLLGIGTTYESLCTKRNTSGEKFASINFLAGVRALVANTSSSAHLFGLRSVLSSVERSLSPSWTSRSLSGCCQLFWSQTRKRSKRPPAS